MGNKKFKVFFLLILIVALGIFLRIYNINNAPPGIFPDEAVNGQDAIRALESKNFQWFYPDNNGREGLFINLIALSFGLLGISVFSLKLTSIIFGTLTVLGVYLLGKELFGDRVGLISAFLASVSFWAINFSRIAFRAIMLPAVLVLSFYFLFRGLRTRKWIDFAIGGFIFGLGLHTYIAFRIAPLILIVSLASLMLSRQGFLKEYWKKIVVFVLFVTISAAPMLYTFFVSHPEYLESRSASISILSPEVNKGHLIETFSKSLGLSLIKYNFWGDQNWRHNYPPYPILDPATGLLFLFGVLYSLSKAAKLLIYRLVEKERNPEMDKCVFLVIWFVAMLAPEFLTYEGIPHALRSIGTLPVVFIFSGITLDFFLKKSEKHTYLFKKIAWGVAILILAFVGIFNSTKYHYFWANKLETAQSFEKVLQDISNHVNALSQDKEVFVVLGNMQRVPVRLFSWNRVGFYDLESSESDKINPSDINNFEIIFTDFKKEEIIADSKIRFPNLVLEQITDSFGMSYYVLK